MFIYMIFVYRTIFVYMSTRPTILFFFYKKNEIYSANL